MTQLPQHLWINRQTLAWLLVAQAVSILPLFFYLPLWVPALWLLSLFWRVQIYRGAWAFPSSKIKFVLGLACIAGLAVSFAGTLGVEPLAAFLVVSFVLKLVEVKKRSDVLLIIYVGFIAIAAQFLFYQTIWIALYGSLTALLLLSTWSCLYLSKPRSIKKHLQWSLSLFAQSLPLMVILFIFLPRLGSLWYVPIPKKTGVTGFSDTMSPGDFSSLSQSREVAFRVNFEGQAAQVPAQSRWYWRGLVLDDFDGRNWAHSNFARYRRSNQSVAPLDDWQLRIASDANTLRYNILMEPHQRHWLFTLMAPTAVTASGMRTFFTRDFLVKASKPLASRTQYHVVSRSDYRASPETLSASQFQRNLYLPTNSNPRARALVDQWRQQGVEGPGFIEQALSFYRRSHHYTLRPPQLNSAHSVDEFLFDTLRGFCEHFASSFTVLMRSAGIPTRVVVGYQGGEFNPVENYIIVRQSDAHAWAEVWLRGRGWVRVDPTAAVSPARIESGLESSLSEQDRSLVGSIISARWISDLQLRLDALSYSWHRLVLGYDSDKQNNLFKQLLGGAQVWRIGLVFAIFVSLLLVSYFFWLTWRVRPRFRYPEQRIYMRHLAQLKRKGFVPNKGEAALDFARRIGDFHPSSASQLRLIAALYNEIAYNEKVKRLPDLKRMVNTFSLK